MGKQIIRFKTNDADTITKIQVVTHGKCVLNLYEKNKLVHKARIGNGDTWICYGNTKDYILKPNTEYTALLNGNGYSELAIIFDKDLGTQKVGMSNFNEVEKWK